MPKVRNPGPALVRTYITLKPTRKGMRFNARIIDIRTGQEARGTDDRAEEAVMKAWTKAVKS